MVMAGIHLVKIILMNFVQNTSLQEFILSELVLSAKNICIYLNKIIYNAATLVMRSLQGSYRILNKQLLWLCQVDTPTKSSGMFLKAFICAYIIHHILITDTIFVYRFLSNELKYLSEKIHIHQKNRTQRKETNSLVKRPQKQTCGLVK